MPDPRFSLKRKWEFSFSLTDKEIEDLLLILNTFKEFSNRTGMGEKHGSAALLADMLIQSLDGGD